MSVQSNLNGNDIAIIGMACRVPGADSPSELWEALISSKDLQTKITRFNSAGFYKESGAAKKGLTNVQYGYFLDHDISRFDSGFFSISPLEAAAMDPQQRLLLEVAYEAIESAGITLESFQGTDTAVYTGLSANDYNDSLLRDIDATPKYHSTGTSNSMAANRLSYFFDLHGPSAVVDTACSSTMVALHQAILSMKAKEAGMALVCGANLIINPDMFVHMSELGFLSPSGKCRSFDAAGDGYARGEGVLALLLKPLEKALESGDPIRSVIRGSRINQDGRTNGITLPSSDAQLQNMMSLYQEYGLSPGDVHYLEAHGTGTAVGDPIELGAIESMFAVSHRAQKLIVGSIKSNVGHLEACAALIGIIKTVECLERGQIPPQLHFVDPNPNVNFKTLEIPTVATSWPITESGLRCAAVNSFGFGGTNGHMVMENFPLEQRKTESGTRPLLLKISATNESSLDAMINLYVEYIEKKQPLLNDLAYTLLARRSTLRKSLFFTATTTKEAIEKLRTWRNGSLKVLTQSLSSTPKLGFIFTGQGAQWAGMGKQLIETSKIFATVVDECDRVLQTLPDRPAWKIREEMSKPLQTSQIYLSSYSQPICTAFQLALFEMWSSWGVTPHAIVGHSSGEIAAAYSAGLLSLQDAIIVAFYRGLCMENDVSAKKLKLKGAMCAIGLSETECMQLLIRYTDRVNLAAVNSPSSCTLSGDEDAVQEIINLCKDQGTFCRALRVDIAYHSHHMIPLAPLYEKSLHKIGIPTSTSTAPKFDMFSSVSQQRLSVGQCTCTYWVDNMVSTVHFATALKQAIQSHGLDIFLELGPHPALKGPALEIMSELGIKESAYFNSCSRNHGDMASMLETVGELINAGVCIQTANVNRTEILNGCEAQYKFDRVLTDLPVYQWDHSTSLWAETMLSRNHRFRKFPRHQLLGARSNNDTPLHRVWRNILLLRELDWMEDFISSGGTKLPLSTFLLMALEAVRQLYLLEDIKAPLVRLKNVKFKSELDITNLSKEGASIETHFNLQHLSHNLEFYFIISAIASNGVWIEYCTGEIYLTFDSIQRQYGNFESSGHDVALLGYIKSFGLLTGIDSDLLDSLRLALDHASGRIAAAPNNDEHFYLHPTQISSLLQISRSLMLGSGAPALYQIQSIDLLEISIAAPRFRGGDFSIDIMRTSPVQSGADIQIHDSTGNYMSIQGIQLERHQLIQQEPPLSSLFFKPEILPDITCCKISEPVLVTRVIELVTHKWPMSDIGIGDLSTNDTNTIRSYMQNLHLHGRPRFRSLNILSNESNSKSGRVYTINNFNTSPKFHLWFGSAATVHSSTSYIRQTGLVCVRIDNDEAQEIFDHKFHLIGRVKGFESCKWLLGQSKPLQNGAIPTSKVKVISCHHLDNFHPCEDDTFEYTHLNENAIVVNAKEDNDSNITSNLIILDNEQQSILTTWPGKDLLPWLQSILKNARTLLWVSCQNEASPFGNVAGSFVRTVKSEHPSIRAINLTFEEECSPGFFKQTVWDVYHDMTQGGTEVELFVQNSQICTLRYKPDDELSTTVGLAPPCMANTPLGSAPYEVSLNTPEEVVLLSRRWKDLDEDFKTDLCVSVKASVIDYRDMLAFNATIFKHGTWEGLGQFFAGRIVSSQYAAYKPNSLAVGWQIGAHRSELCVPLSQIISVPQDIRAEEAVVHYAAYCTAFATLHGSARARVLDTLSICVTGLFAEALLNVCRQLGIIVVPQSTKAKFVVTSDKSGALFLNGAEVSTAEFMTSGIAPKYMEDIWTINPRLQSSISVWRLDQVQSAFQYGKTNPIATVLTHQDSRQIYSHVLEYKLPKRLFRDTGSYILVGGLGGLGRCLSVWMVSNGAKYLTFISRRGTGSLLSEDAKATLRSLQDLGAEVSTFQADAGDKTTMDNVLNEVRRCRPIRGCFNLAMVLDNAPLMSMKPAQWDNALRAKVDSTWNLHHATSSDNLDMFIMFSSISSICGNRTQANYATGNSFQNSLASYRRSLGLPGISIALGVMSGIGVLAEDHTLLRTLRQSGFRALKSSDLLKVVEAAVIESQHMNRTIISVGFEMFESIDDVVQSNPDQNQLFWAESPEFGFLLDHQLSTSETPRDVSLQSRLYNQKDRQEAYSILLDAFLTFFGNMLGYDITLIDPMLSIASYGMDSLSAVACRYWFFKELEIDVPTFEILGSKSISKLVLRTVHRLQENAHANTKAYIPLPSHYEKELIATRPISHSQRRLWFLYQFIPDKTVHNLLLVCHISGILDVSIFKEVWSHLIQRHEILHSKIVNSTSGLQQIPSENPTFILTEVEASYSTPQEQIDNITKIARSFIFNPEAGELVRGWLLKSSVGWRFFLASHHLAWDRASVPTIFKETITMYNSLKSGEPVDSALPPVPYQFIDYTLWQHQILERADLIQPHIDYWRTQLAGIPEAIPLFETALTSRRPEIKQSSADSIKIRFDASMVAELKAFCKSNAITPFMFMASALSILVFRLTGENDVIIGIADADRGHTEFDSLIGFTVNMLPIRSRINKDMLCNSFLEHYRRICLEAYEHRILPWDFLLQQLSIRRRTDHNPVFQITVNYQVQGSFPEYDYGDFKFTQYDHYNATSLSDFGLDIEETTAGELDCVFDFDVSLYTRVAMLDVAKMLKTLVKNILTTKGLTTVDKIGIIPAEHQDFISNILQPKFENNLSLDTLKDNLFLDLLSSTAAAYSTKSAVVDDTRDLTYAELDLLTNQVANFLIEQGFTIGDRIGVYCEPNIEMITAIFGILKAGCVYVPIDPDFPEERIRSMVTDTKLSLILIDNVTLRIYERLVACGIASSHVHTVSSLITSVENKQSPKLCRRLGGSDAVCCLFTSGSTGRPKGIYISHGQLRYHIEGYHIGIETNELDRILLASAPVFDMSLASIFGAALHGATLILASRDARYSPLKMTDLLLSQQVSNCTITVTQLKMLLASLTKKKLSEWASLRSLVIGGEQVPPWVVHDFYALGLPNASLFNGYGPTETTVCNSLRRLSPEDALRLEIPLGPPLFPASFYILDKNMDPVPIGFVGELYIGGPIVSKGYINLNDINAEAFLTNPFTLTKEEDADNKLLYRSGDSFRIGHDAALYAMGRVGRDRQMKIRGMRTELSEIESVICDALKAIDDQDNRSLPLAAVVCHKVEGKGDILAAYITTGENSQIENSEEQYPLKEYLRLRVKAILPVYMRPSCYVMLQDLPRTVSGKIDYRTITSWEPPWIELNKLTQNTSQANKLTKLQSMIASIWKNVLLTDRDFSPADDFFAFGGHSISLIYVQDEIQERCGTILPLADMFANPTIQQMESLIENQSTSNLKRIDDPSNGKENVDWSREKLLPPEMGWFQPFNGVRRVSVIVITGACTMAGAHFIDHVLRTTTITIHCVAIAANSAEDAYNSVLTALKHWHLFEAVPTEASNRLLAYCGSLSHPTLGLTPGQIDYLDQVVDTIFHLDSEVSLLKHYRNLRASNVGSVKFLITLAYGKVNRIKAIHYLSTWGVPHLQAWNKTKLSKPKQQFWHIDEVEMTDMEPGGDGTLGYLKARWVCESMLYEAAHRGLPITIFRSCMCSSSAASGVPLPKTDINRNILAASLQTGLVPDFDSKQGGGMSWISADFLVQSMLFLSQLSLHPPQNFQSNKQPRIFHIVSDRHIPYAEIPELLGTSEDGEKRLKLVEPTEWFEALRQTGDSEIMMHAEVLEQWVRAGWIPFRLEASHTLNLLQKEAGLVPPQVGREFLINRVVGR